MNRPERWAAIPEQATGWIYTDARLLVACPLCGQAAGEHCQMPTGRQSKYPHKERIGAMFTTFPIMAECCRAGTPENSYVKERNQPKAVR